jgi:light-regulated signal transduction histidine kinase (bacteriophytochrome)
MEKEYLRRGMEQIALMNAELERCVEERVKDMEEAYKRLDSFSYTIVHELKTPIRVIETYAQFLKEDAFDVLDAGSRESLAEIDRVCKRTLELIVKLLEHTKMSSKEIRFNYVDMDALVLEVYHEIKSFYSAKPVILQAQQLPKVLADAFLLRHVVYNLLSNSVKYAKSGQPAVIRVYAEADDDQVTYYFADNGIGFDMRYAHQLFTMFHQLHAKNEYEGSGIGLYTVKQIIEKHQGSVYINAQPGVGCIVWFTLPKNRARTAAAS